MNEDSRALVLTAAALSAGNLLLLWWFRFLPLFDYPVWLYESYLLRNIATREFAEMFELVNSPVPNLGLTGIVYLLAFFMPIEIAGKVFLSISVAAFPWSMRYCAIRLGAPSDSPVGFAGFPFVFGPYFFAGQGFYFGLVLLFFTIGYVASRKRVHTAAYAIAFVVAFLVHGLIFVLLTMTLVILRRREGLRDVLIGLIPATLLFVWYNVSLPSASDVAVGWSLWSTLQSAIKPFLLFTKSYGISPALPLSIVNILWLSLFALFLWSLIGRDPEPKGLTLAGFVLVPMAVVLPDNFLNIVQPGGRLMLPAILLLVLGYASRMASRIWSWALLGAGGIVLLYNTHHFSIVDEQMQSMYSEVRSSGVLEHGRFAVVRLDWPPGREWPNALAPSIDPLFGVPYYAVIGEKGVSQIFGTSVLRPRSPGEMPTFRGSTPDAMADDIISQFREARPYDVMILVGAHAARDRVETALLDEGFAVRVSSKDWLVLQLNKEKSGE